MYTINGNKLPNLRMTQMNAHIHKIPTHLCPVVELFQQVFVQVRGTNSSNPLAPDQSFQLLPGWLKVSQSLAVALHGPRGRYDDRVKLGHCQRLAGYRWETNKIVKKKCSYQLCVIFYSAWKCCWRDLKLTHLHCISDRRLTRLTQEQLYCKSKATVNMLSLNHGCLLPFITCFTT